MSASRQRQKRVPWRRLRPSKTRLTIQLIAQQLPGLEVREVLLADLDAVAGAWVAAHAGVAAFDRKCAETTKLSTVTSGQRHSNLI